VSFGNAELGLFLADAHMAPAEKINNNIQTIIELQDLAREAGSYACLLSGGHMPVSGPPEGQGHIDTKTILEDRGLYERYLFARSDGNTLRNMAGFNRHMRSERQTRKGGSPGGHPFDKFYLSLDLTSKEKVAQGEQFFQEVVDGALDSGALLATKDYIHAYDALLLYTYRPHSPLIAGVLQELYPEYREAGLFYSTKHFLQGEISDIAPDHIGFVHEPAYSNARTSVLGSHSQRMRRLGGCMDMLGPNLEKTLTPSAFIGAAAVAKVRPDMPYIVPENMVA